MIYSSSVEFNVEKIQDVEWNEDAFDNLVLPNGHKYLLQSLVEAHHKEIGFDDFIKGKGHGLVVNLFGPPGVGERPSYEAQNPAQVVHLVIQGKPSRQKLRANFFAGLCML